MPLDTSYGNALRILTTPPPPAKVTYVTIIPGHARGPGRRAAARPARPRQLPRGDAPLAAARSGRLRRARAHTPSLEGFLFPDTYQLYEPLRIRALVDDQLTTFKHEFATVELALRARSPSDPLRRPDHRLADPGRGRDRSRHGARLLGHLQPPAQGSISGSTRPRATRPATTPNPLTRLPDRLALAVEHAQPRRPAADADQQPRAGGDPGGRASAAHQLPVLRRHAVRQRRDDVHRQLPAVPGRLDRLPGGTGRRGGHSPEFCKR